MTVRLWVSNVAFRLSAALGAASIFAAVALACGDAPPRGLPEDGGAPPHDPVLAHVHGLGINPADGQLYAATHTGLFRVARAIEPERVGGFFDLMGFTVAGPDEFLASGHPSPAGCGRAAGHRCSALSAPRTAAGPGSPSRSGARLISMP